MALKKSIEWNGFNCLEAYFKIRTANDIYLNNTKTRMSIYVYKDQATRENDENNFLEIQSFDVSYDTIVANVAVGQDLRGAQYTALKELNYFSDAINV